METASKVRVFVVDDHPIARHGLLQLIGLQPDLVVCGEASNAFEALESISSLEPDIVVSDLSLGNGTDGIELLGALKRSGTRVPVLILSVHDEARHAERALRAGASGYIMKHEATEVLLTAIRQIMKGDLYVSERMGQSLVAQLLGAQKAPEKLSVKRLTDRELEIFSLVGKGRSTKQIAEELKISAKTVESHQSRIKRKLQIQNARGLIQRAIAWVAEENI